MKYGFFDDNAKEYVITRPDTPLPCVKMILPISAFDMDKAHLERTKDEGSNGTDISQLSLEG